MTTRFAELLDAYKCALLEEEYSGWLDDSISRDVVTLRAAIEAHFVVVLVERDCLRSDLQRVVGSFGWDDVDRLQVLPKLKDGHLPDAVCGGEVEHRFNLGERIAAILPPRASRNTGV